MSETIRLAGGVVPFINLQGEFTVKPRERAFISVSLDRNRRMLSYYIVADRHAIITHNIVEIENSYILFAINNLSHTTVNGVIKILIEDVGDEEFF